MKIGNNELYVNLGWYKGDPFVFFNFSLVGFIDDYPSGWMSCSFIRIQFLKFVFDVGISKL
jgi:hypothetical protein